MLELSTFSECKCLKCPDCIKWCPLMGSPYVCTWNGQDLVKCRRCSALMGADYLKVVSAECIVNSQKVLGLIALKKPFPSNQGEIILGYQFDHREGMPPGAREHLHVCSSSIPCNRRKSFNYAPRMMWKTQWWLEAALNCVAQPEPMTQTQNDEDKMTGLWP